jgi:hypothetical protein
MNQGSIWGRCKKSRGSVALRELQQDNPSVWYSTSEVSIHRIYLALQRFKLPL